MYRWMVTCTSPDLPLLLGGMLQDRRDRAADARLRTRGTFWSALIDRWRELLDSGGAGWADGSSELVPASATSTATRSWAWIGDEDSGLTVAFASSLTMVAAYLVRDDGPVVRLVAPGPTPARPVSVPAGGERPTVWVFRGLALGSAGEASAEMENHLGRDDVEVLAFRCG